MKIILVIFCFISCLAHAENISGNWEVESVRCLQGDPKLCQNDISSISINMEQNPIKVCFEYAMNDGKKETSCITEYDFSKPNYNPVKSVINKREIRVSSDGNSLQSTVTKQDGDGQQTIQTLSFHRRGQWLGMYDYQYKYRLDSHSGYQGETPTLAWVPDGHWKKEYFLKAQ